MWKNLITNWQDCKCEIYTDFVQFAYNWENAICVCFHDNNRDVQEINYNSLYQKALHTFYHYIIQLMQDKKNDAKVIYLINQLMFKQFPFYNFYIFQFNYDEKIPMFDWRTDTHVLISIPHYDAMARIFFNFYY